MGRLLQLPYYMTIRASHLRREVESSWSKISDFDFFRYFLRFSTEMGLVSREKGHNLKKRDRNFSRNIEIWRICTISSKLELDTGMDD